MTETQNVEQAFSDLESAFEDLRQAPVRDFVLGTLLMTGKALMSVRAARRDYAEFQELKEWHGSEAMQGDHQERPELPILGGNGQRLLPGP